MSSSKIYLGLDVHKDSVTIAVLPEGAPEPVDVRRLPNEPKRLRKFIARWAEEGEIHACYEASGAGYVLQRQMREWGYSCEIVAPSLIPTRRGDRRKFDKKDAGQLARWYRAGELVTIRVPTEAEERVRDLVRCREAFQRDVLRARHRVLKFLARRGLVYRDGENWTQKHFRWLRELLQDETALPDYDRVVFSEYFSVLEYQLQRRAELDRRIEEIAELDTYRPAVRRLRCFRGIDTLAAMVLLSEVGDFRRFEHPRQLMAYWGLAPSEQSSGDTVRRGAITKTGNARCRHILVQAGWSYRNTPRVGEALKRRQQDQPPSVITHAWKAQHRLHKVYRRLEYRKNSRIAVVAVARELTGFIWATMQDLETAAT
jgi:transposase